MLCPHGLPVEGASIEPIDPDMPIAPDTPIAGVAPVARVAPVTPLATSTRPPVVRRLPDPEPAHPGIERDPYPLYRTLRQRFPLVYDRPFGAWLVSRYADVRAALADPGSSPRLPDAPWPTWRVARTARTGRWSHQRSADTP